MNNHQSGSRLAKRLYECGIKAELGILKGKPFALPWHYFRLAAILGNTQAQFTLALNYAAGLDGRKNRTLALAWFKRAARAGEELCALVSPKPDSTPEEQIRLFAEALSKGDDPPAQECKWG